MLFKYRKKKGLILQNLIIKTKTAQLLTSSQRKNFEFLRKPLIQYAIRYQRNYPFDILEEVADYLEYFIQNPLFSIDQIENRIKDHIEMGQNEYSFSLNEISNAFSILIQTKYLTLNHVLSALNHILIAYSFNFENQLFLKQEHNFLLSILEKYKIY